MGQARVAHERKGVETVRANARAVTTLSDLHAFLLLGGHKVVFFIHHWCLSAC